MLRFASILHSFGGLAGVAKVDDASWVILPLQACARTRHEVGTREAAPGEKPVFLEACRDRVTQMMKDLRRFQQDSRVRVPVFTLQFPLPRLNLAWG